MPPLVTASMLYDHVVCPHRVSMDAFGNPNERGSRFEILLEDLVSQIGKTLIVHLHGRAVGFQEDQQEVLDQFLDQLIERSRAHPAIGLPKSHEANGCADRPTWGRNREFHRVGVILLVEDKLAQQRRRRIRFAEDAFDLGAIERL